MKPTLYSLPPAGNKIPIKAIMRAIRGVGDHSTMRLESVQDLLGAKYTLYLSSGRAALWLILKALSRIKPKKQEIIIPAYSCPAVASAVLKAGLRPILCDIKLKNYGFSMDDLKTKINDRTLAVVLVHLFGYPANIEETSELSKHHHVFLIEDAAQAFGNTLIDSPESKLGLLGDAGFFSFGRGKPLSLCHGGIFVTASDEIYQESTKIYEKLKNVSRILDLGYLFTANAYTLFSNPYVYWIAQRMPFLHLGETIFQSDFSVSKGSNLALSLMYELTQGLEKERQAREVNSTWYATHFNNLSAVENPPHPQYPYLRYPLIVEEKTFRDDILEKLMAQGTGAALFYPCPLNELPGLREILRDNNYYPNAKRLSDCLITLPVHSGVRSILRQKIHSIVQRVLDPESRVPDMIINYS